MVSPKSPLDDKQRSFVGRELGFELGETLIGRFDGFPLGISEGFELGPAQGLVVGFDVGRLVDGFTVGFAVGVFVG